MSFLVLPIRAMANDPADLIATIKEIPEVKAADAKIIFCFSNEDFRNDLYNELGNAFDHIKDRYPLAVEDRSEEMCVNSSLVKADNSHLAFLQEKFKKKKDVTLEVYKSHQPAFEESKKERPDLKTRIVLTLRGALVGAAGSLVSNAMKPGYDMLSNKGDGESISLKEGAIIGAIVDMLQRANGATDNKAIAAYDFSASIIGGMLKTKDPNVVGLAVVLTLSQVTLVKEQLEKLSTIVPRKLDWKIPAALIGSFYLLSKLQKDTAPATSMNTMIGGMTYGPLAYAVGSTYNNETTGFIVAAGASLLDEICDATTKKCQGRFTFSELFVNTIGSYVGAKLSTRYSPKVLFGIYKKGVSLTYQTKF